MAENALKALNLKQNPKGMVKRGALRVINGDINTRKRSNHSRKPNCKSQKQENSENDPHILNRQKTFVHENENVGRLKWNCLSQNHEESKNKSHVPDKQASSGFEHDGDSIDLTTDEDCLPSSANDVLSVSDTPLTNPITGISSGVSTEHDEISSEANKIFISSHNKKNNERLTSDFVWCTPYRNDIYNYFKNVEKKFRPNPNYMDKQSDITTYMRSVLIDWFVEVGEEYKLQTETVHLAVSYVDRFLSHMRVLRGKLQLVGTASMFLAAKYEEIYPPELSDFVYITDDTYTKKQILRMEHLILKVLNFDVSVPTAYTFLQLYCSMCNASETVLHLSQYICELSLLDGDPFLKFDPSAIAAGCLALANYILGFDMWSGEIVASSGYQLTDLMYIILCLYNKYSAMPTCSLQAMYDKYKSQRFSAVASIPQPDNLTFPESSSKRLCYI